MSDYVSTRDSDRKTLSYSDVLLAGLAPDRGLYVPTSFEKIDLKMLVGLPYTELFMRIKSTFIGADIPTETQKELAEKAFTPEKFPHTKDGVVTPLTQITPGFYIQQLSLGPTAAFKDMALQPLGQDMQYVLGQRAESLVLLGATSGDTGSAAENAVKDLPNIKLFMLSPEEGMYEFQHAQMGNLSGGNIVNISVRGRFDDCQDIVKAINMDPNFSKLGAVNSINWARIASQVPYYFAGYLQVVGDDLTQEVDFVVPTGNFGNILAGYIARKMGLPIRKLIVATNENNVVDRLIQTGTYSRPKEAFITSSPSMDITVASNYERVVYDLFSGDAAKVRAYMEQFEKTGTVTFADFGMTDDTLQKLGFDSATSTEADRVESTKWVYEQKKLVIDPHTADAITVGRQKQDKTIPIICMSTALPVKAEPFIQKALGFVPPREHRFADLEKQSTPDDFIIVDNDLENVKLVLHTHTQQGIL